MPGPNVINCDVPLVNVPESFIVEVSFDETHDDFTNNGLTYTFYDAYVIRVEPQMVSSQGRTKIRIYGYGFADSGSNLKVKFGSSENPIKCDFKNCIANAVYISDNLIEAETFPREVVVKLLTSENIGYDRFNVEVSVYMDDFTKNNITIFYYDQPEIIIDIYASTINMDPITRETLGNTLIRSIPANIDTLIPIPIDSRKIQTLYKTMDPFLNLTCRYQIFLANSTVIVNETIYKITPGILSSFPTDSNLNNLFLCQSPEWEVTGQGRIQISLNGYDFSETEYQIAFTDPIYLERVIPPCGPLTGGTNVRLYGTGFVKRENYVFKWGPQNLVSSINSTFLDYIKTEDISLLYQHDFRIQKVEILSPEAPDSVKTVGGLDYISISSMNYLPLDDFLTKYFANNYIHTNFEFYYYKQPYVQSFSPHGSIVTGGTQVLVVGAWFQYKPQYEVIPYCKFGEKIVQAEYLSTVRISCYAPSYGTPDVKVPFYVSLNKYDFVDTGLEFIYYNDFTNAKFERITPQSGPDTGGTSIKIYGKNFTKLVTKEEFLCQFKPEKGSLLEPKNVPALYTENILTNETAIICNSPGGWTVGTRASILITFDGQNFMDTNFDFYFYKIDDIYPLGGPTTGEGSINIVGGGFKNSTKVKCFVDHAEYKPIKVKEHLVQCPMPATYGNNFTGYVDLAISLNGIDVKEYKYGFYYYYQPVINDIFPKSGPSKGNATIRVYGDGFTDDFRGAHLGCKIGETTELVNMLQRTK